MKTKETNRRRIISRTKWFRRELAVIFSLYFICTSVAFANPYGAQIVNGNVSMSTQGNILNITNSPNSIINWQGFSIAANEMTRFNQQNSASAVLNRIVGQNPSAILGALQSNGKVFLINPNGVLFGQGARIEVNGLVASTLNLSNQDFLAGKYNFTAGLNPGSIKNQGSILTPNGGQVYLIAPDIENTGIINSPKGDIILAAGHSVNLVDSADPFISVVVSAPADKAVNLGQIVAQSGRIGIYGGLIKQSSIVNADSAVVGEGGKILFKASKEVTLDPGSITSAKGGGTIGVFADMQNGTVNVAGTLDASAPNGGNGGAIETSAANVKIADTAHITTLAPYGKSGSWLIDPNDFTIAASGGDMTGATLSSNLGTTDVTILSSSGATAGNGDIFVNDAVSWATSHGLTLNAYRDIVINGTISNSFTSSGPFLRLRADATGTGSGTVTLGINGQVSFGAGNMGDIVVYYNPADYLAATYATDKAYFDGKILAPSGTKTYYMLVNDVNNLQAMNTNLTGVYAVGKNIDASATANWNPDGSGGYYGFLPVSTFGSPFTGTFEGDGHAITGLYINRPSGPTSNCVGLFGHTGPSGVIRNVGLINGNIAGYNVVGGLVALHEGIVSNSYSAGTVGGGAGGGSGEFGGLVGENKGSIMNSYTAGAVSVNGNYVGGLVGNNYVGGAISNSYSTAAVNGNYAGGLVGYNAGASISNSYSTGVVNGTNLGGLIGMYNSGVITNSYWDTVTSGQSTSGGGMGTGLTTNQMMIQDNYSGWDFGTTWWMSDGNTRPFLRSEYSTTITNAHQLQLVAMDLAASYTVGNNIDMSELRQASGLWNTATGFLPLGDTNTSFTGQFNGLGRTITGLFINRPLTDGVGLFGYVSDAATIQNVRLVNASVTGYSLVGSLAGHNLGSISNSTSSGGAISGDLGDIGGLVGWNESGGVISDSLSTGTVTGSGTSGGVGGLVGNNHGGSVTNSTSIAGVVGGRAVGGLVGANDTAGIISNSSSSGSVSGDQQIGGLAGYNYTSASISNSFSTGAVSGNSMVGGLVGQTYSSSTINISYHSTGDVSGTSDIGGLVGYNGGAISNSYNLGNAIGTSSVGGIAGYNNNASIDNSYSTGAISGNAQAGGLVGISNGSSSITNSYSTGAVTGGTGDYFGGLVGYNGAVVSKSFATGAVSCGAQGEYTGGLVGLNFRGATISNSYATGMVSGGLSFIGGLVGYNMDGTVIEFSYSTGAVSGTGQVGGLIGWNNNGTITSSYWDTQTSGQAASAGGTGLTSAQMKMQESFAGWDFVNTWSITEGSYPCLRGQNCAPPTYTLLFKADDKTKIFGDPNPVFTSTITGYAAGDTATTAFTGFPSYALSGEDVGTQTITVSIGTLASAVQGKYTFTFAPGLMTISPKILSIVTAALTGTASKTYDGTTTAILSPGNFLLSGFVNGDSATVTKTTGTYATKNVGSGIEVSTSLASSDFSPAGSTNLSNYTLPAGASGNIGTITPATLLVTGITAQNKVYDATTGAAISTGSATLAGIIGSDVVSMNGGSGAFTDKNVGAGKLVKVSGITLSGPDAGNYTINTSTASLSATADITKAPLTVTADDKTRIYGDANPAFTGRLSGFVGGETEGSSGVTGAAVYTTSASESSNAGAYSIIPGAGTLTAGNYSFASLVNGTLTVGRAPLSIIADDKVKLSGTPNPAFTVTHAGFKLGQNESVLGGVLSFATEATTASPEGTYKITPSGRTSDNYSITFVDGVLTVNPGEAVQQQQNSVLVAAINSAGKPTETVINMETRPGSDEEKDKDKTGGSSTTQEGQNSETKKQSLPYCN